MTRIPDRLRTPNSYRETAVPIRRSIETIEQVLIDFKAQAIGVSIIRRDALMLAQIAFAIDNRAYKIQVNLGEKEKEQRQRLRVLYWFIKATLESIVFGVASAQDVLLPFLQLPGGETVADILRGTDLPQLGANSIFPMLAKALPSARSGR